MTARRTVQIICNICAREEVLCETVTITFAREALAVSDGWRNHGEFDACPDCVRKARRAGPVWSSG